MRRPVRLGTAALVLASILVFSTTAAGAVDRPAYAAGDHWVYELTGSLDALPGVNDTEIGSFALTVAARVDVDVRALSARGVEVSTRTTGYLNGTFELPPGLIPSSVVVTGTLTSDLTEVWEPNGYFAVEARDRTTYAAEVPLIIPVEMEVELWTNATTRVDAGAVFPLGVGDRVAASLETNVSVDATVRAFGSPSTWSNETTLASTWSREALAEADVSVDAGTFHAVRLNQSLAGFPGLSGFGTPPGGNETAFWSNDVRYYVQRTAYVNGTPVLTMELKSFTPGTQDSLLILVSVAAVAAGVLALVWFRRRSKPASRPAEPTTPRSSGEADPKEDSRAR